ncbi:WecB/TagA/CpsF family glycosyltransferase [Cohnella sp. 56]|uniref:WecB/TagA/CpsF family glycosyltransferase n=1 Tax=Cohnella sp. 56 TaxID=3113722 RepID=UPI0030E82B96
MINKGKYPIGGVNVCAMDYEAAVQHIVKAALVGLPCAVSALAVHGVMTGCLDPVHRRRLNGLDIVLPDGQPVRWGLNFLHGTKLEDRVYGPNLTLKVAEAAARHNLPIYLYGSRLETLELFSANLKKQFPGLVIAGMEPSRFRKLNIEEKAQTVNRIKASGAKLVFVGLGCPRQEVWAYEYRELLSMPLLAVGAAFDFHAGTLKQAPTWMQDRGLEWFYRLYQEPRRLWRRYLYLNPLYLFTLLTQRTGMSRRQVLVPNGDVPEESYG